MPGEPNYTPSGASGTNSTTALFQAGAGYDLATGLGSINVTNLVNSWGSVVFHPTTTSLTLSSISMEHGSAATVAVTVTPQSGTGVPTGNVSLIPSAGAGSDLLTLSSGSASSSISALPGGTYTLTAHYGGDSTYGASNLAPVSMTVTPEPSVTAVGALAASTIGISPGITSAFFSGGTYGSANMIYSAQVAGLSGQGTPTGAVTFTVNGGVIDQAFLILRAKRYPPTVT